MNFTAHIYGRRKGAIGCFQNFVVTVDAKNEDDARLKLYDTHQDIIRCIIVRADDGLPLDTMH
jgi:hypothetical protein